jgi:hypothetical protein
MRHIWWLLVPATFSLAAPAQARPRDDALSSAIRCGAIADSRQWLDCYYGAAQPMRVALGLAPALAAQVQLAASPPAGGQPRDEAIRTEVVSGSASCMREAADRAWLDCYYAAAMAMRVQLGLSAPQTAIRPAPAPQPVLASAPATVMPAANAPAGPPKLPPMPPRVGILGGLFTEKRPVVRDMAMQSFERDKNGSFTITLIDGEVWEQVDEDHIYHPARWRRAAAEMRVTITPDAMHTYIMTVEGENYMYKVRRIH